jgi:hypothetical protein
MGIHCTREGEGRKLKVKSLKLKEEEKKKQYGNPMRADHAGA